MTVSLPPPLTESDQSESDSEAVFGNLYNPETCETGITVQPGEILSGPLLDVPGPGNRVEDDADGDIEEENGLPREVELSEGSEDGGETGGVVEEQRPARYPSPGELKKVMNSESLEVNTELRALITKEIRKPGRRT